MNISPSIRIHTSIASASTIKGIGEMLVSAKWNETSKQTAMERAVLIPMECVRAPEVPESFRALVEAALMQAAESVLKQYVKESPNQMEMSAEQFARPNLTEAFLARDGGWIGKQELEIAFTTSATWKRISGKREFESNRHYRQAAEMFRDSILKLSGKNVSLEPKLCEQLLSKLEDDDLEGSKNPQHVHVFAFIAKRLETLKGRKSDSVDLDCL